MPGLQESAGVLCIMGERGDGAVPDVLWEDVDTCGTWPESFRGRASDMNSNNWGRFTCVVCEKTWRHPNAGTGPRAVPSMCEECNEGPKDPPEILENPFAFEYEI